jgi:hypothetical protein
MLGVTIKRWASLKVAVMAFWSLDGGFWKQKRLAREHQFVSEKVEAKRSAGRLGGRPKPLNNKESEKADGSENRKQNESELKAPTPTPTKNPIVPKGTLQTEFIEWWAAYPARDGANSRAAAEERYILARRAGASRETLLAAVTAYAVEAKRLGKLGTEYVKQARFFLSPKDRLWEDYAGKAALPAASATASADYLAGLSDARWREEVRCWKSTIGHWPLAHRTPVPDHPETKVPTHILNEFGIQPRPKQAAFALRAVA